MPDAVDFMWLSCYGGRTPTPNIDRIAEVGVRLDQMYCSASACTPSRYSYLTGHYAGRCTDPRFLAENPSHEPYCVAWNTVLDAEIPSVGKVLQANGYRTGIAGKWHCGQPRQDLGLPDLPRDADPENPDVDTALQVYQDILQDEVRRTGGFDYAAGIVWGDNESFPVAALREHNLEWVTQGALDFLDGCRDDRPFFLHVAPTALHGPPHDCSYETDAQFTQGGRVKQPFMCHPLRDQMRKRLEARGLPHNHDTVGITWIDDQVGAILQKIEEMGIVENTVVIFMVDHNTETGKGTCHQVGTHIPMVMAWPGVVEPGTVCGARVTAVDFAPTVFEIADAVVPAGMPLDGASWLPLLTGEREQLHDDLFFEFGYARAVLYENWKYIALRYPQHLLDAMRSGEVSEAPNHINQRLQGQMSIAIETYPAYFDPDQLFDLSLDPEEKHNLADDPACAGVLAMMKRRLQAYLETFDHPFDLEVPDFMHSDRYQVLCDETRKIGTGHLSWWPKERWWEAT